MLVKLCCEYLAYADSLSHTLLLVKFFSEFRVMQGVGVRVN